jgi:ribonuclease BN (tRNA processing enzyme)
LRIVNQHVGILCDQKLVKFAKDADVLIHDAQYRPEDYTNPAKPKQGWGHSTPEMAIAVAQAANASQLVLFHHEPNYDDAMIAEIEANAQKLFPNVRAAYEGMELKI